MMDIYYNLEIKLYNNSFSFIILFIIVIIQQENISDFYKSNNFY